MKSDNKRHCHMLLTLVTNVTTASLVTDVTSVPWLLWLRGSTITCFALRIFSVLFVAYAAVSAQYTRAL